EGAPGRRVEIRKGRVGEAVVEPGLKDGRRATVTEDLGHARDVLVDLPVRGPAAVAGDERVRPHDDTGDGREAGDGRRGDAREAGKAGESERRGDARQCNEEALHGGHE